MSDFFNDPQFPDRPQHPDFWRMVDAVNQHDGDASEGGMDVGDIIGQYVDEQSLIYMGEQRLLRIGVDRSSPNFVVILGLYIDAFILGAGYQKKGGKRG